MPYADNQGLRIHYKVEGEGPPLVLQHGYTMNLERWYQRGYVDALKAPYRLVLIDARGHGGSDKPHDRAAYAWPAGVEDVVAVLDALDLRRTLFWGYSMGGGIGFGLAKHFPQRLQALVIGGAFASALSVGDALRHVDGRDPEDFVAAFETLIGGRFVPQVRAELLASDTQALAAAAHNRPSMEDALPGLSLPCLIYAGDKDPFFAKAQASARRIPGASFVPLAGLGHAEAFIRSDLALPHVEPFLAAHAR
jgi:pimeloyl-ACP methyl ester carboxylesterase